MITLHAKSPCCHSAVKRYGGRRRQCSRCGKTWRIRLKRRGPKLSRTPKFLLERVFNHGWPLQACVRKRTISRASLAKRLRRALNIFINRPRSYHFRKSERFILIIDAEWYRFKKEYWTAYFMAVKSVSADRATILDPILLPGKETLAPWEEVLLTIPHGLHSRIIALITDGFRGNRSLLKGKNWLIQRCHFHLLSAFQRYRGKRKKLKGRSAREELYQTAKLLLATIEPHRVKCLTSVMLKLVANNNLPVRLRMTVNEFIRHLYDFHTYLRYPELHLPNTTNVMESINSMVRSHTKRINNPSALRKWILATVRHHPKLVCKRAIYQPK